MEAVRTLEYAELLDLIQWLPSGSAFRAQVEAGTDSAQALRLNGWTTNEELLLGLINRISALTYVTAKSNGAKGLKPPEPELGPRGNKANTGRGDASAMARSLIQMARKGRQP